MSALAISDLEVRYAGLPVPALSIPSLAVESGAMVALTGPSGSGKTTFINIVTGMDRAGSGTVAWNGENLMSLPQGRRDRWRGRNVGIVMQEFHLFAGMSALSNVLLPQRLTHFGLPEGMADRARILLERVGIERPQQHVETMSRGQMQRVAVARALVGRPGIVIADEPTASLDAEAGAAVADLIVELSREAAATLIVATHEERLIERMEHRIHLENGRPVR